MKLTFLGTGAAEGYPGYWCQCPHCDYARKHGGKNLRANSCLAIDDKLLIDIGPTCFDAAARYGVNLTQITTLLITHPHEDHLYPQALHWRYADEKQMNHSYPERMKYGGPRFSPVPELKIFCNSPTADLLRRSLDFSETQHMTLYPVQEAVEFDADGYHIIPVRANHGPRGFAHSYIIRKSGKTLLYACDTGTYESDMLKLLKRFTYDLVIMECTTGLNEQYGGHMCLASNGKMKTYLERQGSLKPDHRFVLTHMSPHWCPPHDWFETIAGPEGMILAYDGMELEL